MPFLSDNIIRGPPRLPVQDTSVGERLYKKLLGYGDKTVLVDGVTRREVSAREVATLSTKLAAGLQARGIRHGDAVAVCSENSVEYCLPVLAALYLGAACAPLNATYTPRELEHALGLSKPKVVFCSCFTEDKVKEAVDRVDHVNLVVVMGGEPSHHDHIPLTAVYKDVTPDFQLHVVREPSEHVAFIMCSSGTTGLPKGVMVTHSNTLYYFEVRLYHPIRGPDVVDKVLGYLPMSHAMGVYVMAGCLDEGILLIVMPSFKPDHFLQLTQDYKVEYLLLVPPLVAFLAKHPMVDEYDLRALRKIICGAAPLSTELLEQFLAKFPWVRNVIQGYGMTEVTLGGVFTPFGSKNYDSVGTVVPGMELKVVDTKTGSALGPKKPGEICFRGPLVMKGYVDNPQATAEVIDIDGWMHTGDVGYFDENGFLYIVDRIKELIKYKGFQVPPAELEAILMSHPAVMDAAVIGIPDKKSGEVPRAFVIKKKEVTEKELVKFVAKQVSSPKQLRGGVQFVDEIPKNPSGKILRREVKRLYVLNSKL